MWRFPVRHFINIISEAPVDIKDRTSTGFDFMPELEKGSLATTRPTARAVAPGRAAGRGKTRRATRAAHVAPDGSARAMDHLSGLPDMTDTIDDAQAARNA